MKVDQEILGSKLNYLLAICNDGKEGYKAAAATAETYELKVLFTTYAIQRAEFAEKLLQNLRQIEGKITYNISGGPLGVLHRTWLTIKTALTGKDNKAVLDACITGEKAAVEAYDEILEMRGLDLDLRLALMQQRSQVNEALHHIRKLRFHYDTHLYE